VPHRPRVVRDAHASLLGCRAPEFLKSQNRS